ncbi:RsmB/NOP family class I SAM-dependent RNA methyltransferase [Paenibacillus sp. GP183]|uniref:RsmB/NOP family class I SAM-dependent RNA methyltransferase n=1 Tax=Paenibacillus sp. GP183 TaxID=1882751 RepID=UPI00089A9B52|nr:RsmB/NOP family class I SAM-dependent RNA methyltransferase [Paenibacillus sp. GP183]SEB75526.1 NOL1/NOP2/sun family putative RNA methylase [Paenibacillus sp. GP183]
MKLPADYIERMRLLLGEDSEKFLSSYEAARTHGLRFNMGKINAGCSAAEEIIEQFGLEPIPWCEPGYYYDESARPGKHPYHAAGLYYIQEPSAMSVVELLDPKPGDVVLDLAAAPGGKSTHIADKLQGEGLLIANEIHLARAKILSENIERMGIANCVVMNASPDRLAERFPGFFDKIMLDAPCSGEGMIRKDPNAAAEWSVDLVRKCATRQMDILPDAVRMLKPGGILAYSTCTFNREENEDTIQALIERFPELELLQTERIWPHLHKGEGHFAAILKKNAEYTEDLREKIKPGQKSDKTNKLMSEAISLFEDFQKQVLPGFRLGPGEPLLFGNQLYHLPYAAGCSFGDQTLQSLKVVRPGLHLGEVKKTRFIPAHSLALAVNKRSAKPSHTYSLAADSREILAYLHGEALITKRSVQGWVIVLIEDHPVGWGKESEGQLKNHYPKGLRWLF